MMRKNIFKISLFFTVIMAIIIHAGSALMFFIVKFELLYFVGNIVVAGCIIN